MAVAWSVTSPCRLHEPQCKQSVSDFVIEVTFPSVQEILMYGIGTTVWLWYDWRVILYPDRSNFPRLWTVQSPIIVHGCTIVDIPHCFCKTHNCITCCTVNVGWWNTIFNVLLTPKWKSFTEDNFVKYCIISAITTKCKSKKKKVRKNIKVSGLKDTAYFSVSRLA